MNHHKYQLRGMDPAMAIEKVLEAIDKGTATTQEIRQNPLKYLVSGKRKDIVICTGGEGLKVSYRILQEMSKRGDALAMALLAKNKFSKIEAPFEYDLRDLIKVERKGQKEEDDLKWTYLEKDGNYRDYDRENPILIEIIKENNLENIGGWTLEVVDVPVEEWAYQICNERDHWASEYVKSPFC